MKVDELTTTTSASQPRSIHRANASKLPGIVITSPSRRSHPAR